MAVNPPPLVCMKAFDWVESLCELCQSLLTQDPANANAYHDLIRVRARPDHGWAPKLVEILSDRVPYDKTRQTFMGMVECIRFDSEMDNLVQQLFRSVQCGFNPCKYDGHEPDPDSDEQVAGEAAWMAIREGLHLARALLQQFPARFMFCGIDTEDMRVRSNWFASAGGSTETPGDDATIPEEGVIWWHGGKAYSRDGDPQHSKGVNDSQHKVLQEYLAHPGAKYSTALDLVASGSAMVLKRLGEKHNGFFASAIQRIGDRGGVLIVVRDASP